MLCILGDGWTRPMDSQTSLALATHILLRRSAPKLNAALPASALDASRQAGARATAVREVGVRGHVRMSARAAM